MNFKQEQDFLNYISNFVLLLHASGFTREQAETASNAAIACLIGAVYHIPGEGRVADETERFITVARKAALKRLYGEVVA
jgi:hypothetical protein